MLRSVVTPTSQYPNRIRASTLGWWFWCAERSRHYALNLIPRGKKKKKESVQARVGTMLHEVIAEELGMRPPWEEQFIETLYGIEDAVLGFARPFKFGEISANITGHPDDFQATLDGDVTLIEHKTTEINPQKASTKRLIEFYKLPMAKFQLEVYCWIFDDLLRRKEMEGYRLARTHAVMYWHVNHKTSEVKLINWYPYTFYPWSVEHDIRQALEAYANKSKIIKPRPWKCRQCPRKNKVVCQYQKILKEVRQTESHKKK